ncbi:MAG: endonuclease III [Gemmatimonadaceae bacterium]
MTPPKRGPRPSALSKRAASLAERAGEIVRRLREAYPDARCSLDHSSPLELLVATILSAQCTDARVNLVTPALFAKYPSAEHYANATPAVLEEDIRTTGFFRNKTKSLIGMGSAVRDRHGGSVPSSMEELTQLPGVGRKTANVILGNAFRKNEGVVVDTHVARVSQRLGLTRETDPVKIERDLMPLVPRRLWSLLSHLFIFHGRAICEARSPKCEQCMLTDICPSSRV